MDIIVISVSWGESRCPAPADPRSGADTRCACPTSGCAALRNGRRACERAGRLFRRRLGCFRCGPVQGAVPLNSYCYSPRVSTLQARVLTRYLHVIFASRCGNLRGRRGRKSRGGHRATRPRTAQLPLRSRNELSTGPTSHPQATRGLEPSDLRRIYTWRSCFFKASLRRGAYYMNCSLSLPFTDRVIPSAIRPSEVSHSRLARGARGSRPRPADSQGAVFPSAPLRRPVFPSQGGGTHRGVSLPASQRTAAASHRGGPAFRRGSAPPALALPCR